MTEINNVEIKYSAKHGQGAFAARNFTKGEEVYRIIDQPISAEQAAALDPEEKRYLDNVNGQFAIVQPPARYVNHSCEPNIEERDRIGYALRDVSKGQELSIDYDVSEYLEEPFLCNCASRLCKGIIVGKK